MASTGGNKVDVVSDRTGVTCYVFGALDGENVVTPNMKTTGHWASTSAATVWWEGAEAPYTDFRNHNVLACDLTTT